MHNSISLFIPTFLHSCHFYSIYSRQLLLRSAPIMTTASVQCPYVITRDGFERPTLRSKGIDSTNVPPGTGFVAILMEVCSKEIEQNLSDEATKGLKKNALKEKFDQPTGGRED